MTDLNDPTALQGLAKEARTVADGMKDAIARRTMLKVAEAYDRLAELAMRRLLPPHDKAFSVRHATKLKL